MTIEEIEIMPAGREMDALIAWRVMGWKPDVVRVVKELTEGTEADRLLPNFSTDATAAIQAVENSWASGLFYWSEDWYLRRADRHGGDDWAWQVIDTTSENVIAHASTAALALCRALLIAVKVS